MSRQTNSPTDLSRAVIDSLEFARQGRRIVGDVAIAALDRLADIVVDSSGVLHAALRGLPAGRHDGKAGLELEVSGNLKLRCQRCLQAMEYPLQLVGRMLPVEEGGSWPGDDADGDVAGDELEDEWDAIEASREQSVLALIEDEVLLALPIVPRHEACGLPVAAENEYEPSPFAVLAKLKQQ